MRSGLGQFLAVAALLAGGLAGVAAHAQDLRVVKEPVVPPVCTRLQAGMMGSPSANGVTIAASDEKSLDTGRIQEAINSCGKGKAVELVMGSTCGQSDGSKGVWCGAAALTDVFLTGPLELREGVTLLIDKGVTLMGSRDPAVYEMQLPDAKPGDPIKCGTSMPRPTSFPVQLAADARARKGGCRSLINIDHVKNAAVMGEGTLDGRGYAKILGKDYSWWEQARKAEPKDDLYFNPRMITATHADGLVLYGIHLVNAGNFHVGVNGTDGFTAWGVHLQTPVNKKLLGTSNDARNTDGIDPGMSTNVTVAYSYIDNGDDNIAIKAGVSHMSVMHNHFYSGHGMSIGSETVPGQSFLVVQDLTEDHTTSGIRIKSNVKRGGPVHDLIYKDVCMTGVKIPIAISPYYTNQTVEPFENPKYEGEKIPDYKRITLENIHSDRAGDVLIAGLDEAHRTEVSLRNVTVAGIRPEQVHTFYADLNVLVPWSNIPFKNGGTVKVMMGAGNSITPTGGVADPCKGKFVAYR